MQQSKDAIPMVRSRPGTLAEAVRRVKSGEDTFAFALSEFLDTFYLDESKASRRMRLLPEPDLLGDARQDAYVGAIGEHLCRRWFLGSMPKWVNQSEKFLDEPYFTGKPPMHSILMMESPVAFRRRFIFTEAEPLRRSRMPEDGRWWAYENLRSGLAPSEGAFPVPTQEEVLAMAPQECRAM